MEPTKLTNDATESLREHKTGATSAIPYTDTSGGSPVQAYKIEANLPVGLLNIEEIQAMDSGGFLLSGIKRERNGTAKLVFKHPEPKITATTE
jgi:hypothetical protein